MTDWTHVEGLRNKRERNNLIIEEYDKIIKDIDESNSFLRFIRSGKKKDAQYAKLRLLRKNINITDEILLILRTAQFTLSMGNS